MLDPCASVIPGQVAAQRTHRHSFTRGQMINRPSQVRAPRARWWDPDLRTASNDPDESLAVFVIKANLKVKRELSITSKVNGGRRLKPGSP